MAQLAQTDPASWVQEQQRERAIHGVLNQLEQGMQRESAHAQQLREQNQQNAFQEAWGVLDKAGIDKPALKNIFEKVRDKYAVPFERFSQVTDPKLVLILRDAVAYQDLKDKKAQATKKVQAAPNLPQARQAVPRQEQQRSKLNGRFSSGKAKLGDLAAYLNTL